MKYLNKKDKAETLSFKERLKKFFTARSTKRGSLAILITALFIAIVVVINIITITLGEKFPGMSLDLTQNQIFEMQQKTVDYIKDIKDPVTIYINANEKMFSADSTKIYAQCGYLLKQFSQNNENITVKYIPFDENPALKTKFSNIDWTKGDTVAVVESGEDYKAVPDYNFFVTELDSTGEKSRITGNNVEQSITAAILYVIDKNRIKYAVASDLGNIADSAGITNLLDKTGYEMETISLSSAQEIPEDCKLIILYAPVVDISLEASNRLDSFLENNGKYGKSVIYIPHNEPVETPNLDKLLEKWGMKITDGIVYETNTERIIDAGYPLAFRVEYGELFTDTLRNPEVYSFTAQSPGVEITDSALAQPLLKTSDKAGIYPYYLEDPESFDLNANVKGEPINLAAAGYKMNETGETSYLITICSFNMLSAETLEYFQIYNNANFFQNIANTVTGKGESAGVDIITKDAGYEMIQVTEANGMFVRILFMWILPIAVLGIGLLLFMIRKNK